MITLDEWLDDVPKEIIKYPSKILREHNDPVFTFDDKLEKVINEMFSLMYKFNGCGLASPQIGLNLNLFIINPTGDPSKPEYERVLINPEVISYGIRKQTSKEGCLSLPGVFGTIERSRRFLFSAYDLKGEKHKFAFEGMTSKAAQHEFDHIQATLIIDRMKQEELVKYEKVLQKLEEDHKMIPF